MTINKQASKKLKAAAAKANDEFDPNMFVMTRDILALLNELEAAENRNAELIHIISMHTVELGFGEKPITMAELIIAREGSGSDVLAAIRAAGITVKGE